MLKQQSQVRGTQGAVHALLDDLRFGTVLTRPVGPPAGRQLQYHRLTVVACTVLAAVAVTTLRLPIRLCQVILPTFSHRRALALRRLKLQTQNVPLRQAGSMPMDFLIPQRGR
jgi:hypothetical protein